jgi:adenine phosphoribosyltransferase
VDLKKSIRSVPDFPVEGIMFRDVTTLMKDPLAFRESCQAMEDSCDKFRGIDFFAGIEARGFIYASVLSDRKKSGLVLIRKPGKLPSETLSVDYELEYGKDRIEVHADSISPGSRYLVVDDLLATGGTAAAACRLIEQGGGVIAGCLFLVELPDLNGRSKLEKYTVVSLLDFEGE